MVFRRRRKQEAAVAPVAVEASATSADSFDPATLPEPYRRAVSDAMAARRQFDQILSARPEGPMRDRLAELAPRIDAGVNAVRDAARHALEVEQVVAMLDPDRTLDDLKRARREAPDSPTTEALATKFASVQRMLNSVDELRSSLPGLQARLGAGVARAAEISLSRTATGAELGSVAADLDALLGELHAIDAAMGEVDSL